MQASRTQWKVEIPCASLEDLLVKVESGYSRYYVDLIWHSPRGKLTFLPLGPLSLGSNTRLPDPTG